MADHVRRALGLLVMVWSLSGCAALFQPAPTSDPSLVNPEETPLLRIAAAWCAAPVAEELADLYQREHPAAAIRVEAISSQEALAMVRQGRADVALVVEEGIAERQGLAVETLASDALALVVNETNRVASLSREEIQSLFGGYVLNWSELGGPAGEPLLLCREQGAIMRTLFEQGAMAGGAVSTAARVVADDRGLVQAVAGEPMAVAMVPLALVDESVRIVAIGDLAPTGTAYASGAYAWGYDLALVTLAQPPEQARPFVALVASAKGQQLLSRWYDVLR